MLHVPTEAHKEPPPMTATPELPNNSTAGEDPNKAGHLNGLPYDKTPISEYYNEDTEVNEEDLTKLQTGEYWSERPPVKELPAPEKKKISLGVKIAAGTAALAAIGGAMWYGATGGGKVNLPPNPVPTASAPVTPGTVTPIETAPGVTPAPVETAPRETLAFTDKNGNKQTFDELKASIALNTSDYDNGPQALEAFIDVHMNNMIRYNPSEAEVKSILGLNENGRVGLNEYINVSKMRNAAFDHLYDTPAGDLYNAMQEISEVDMKNWYTSLQDPTKPYDPMTMDYDSIKSTISLSDSTGTSKYKLSGPDLSRSVAKVPQYEIPGRMNFTPVKK